MREDFGALDAPELEGITLDGRLAVVYSRFDLGNGWEQFPHPYSYGLKDESSLQIGTNQCIRNDTLVFIALPHVTRRRDNDPPARRSAAEVVAFDAAGHHRPGRVRCRWGSFWPARLPTPC